MLSLRQWSNCIYLLEFQLAGDLKVSGTATVVAEGLASTRRKLAEIDAIDLRSTPP